MRLQLGVNDSVIDVLVAQRLQQQQAGGDEAGRVTAADIFPPDLLRR